MQKSVIYNFLYSRPLWLIIVIMAAGILLWAVLASHRPRYWHEWNAGLFLISLFVIFSITLLDRSAWHRELYLIPFHVLQAAKQQPELYREMLMNVFLFVPLGLTLPQVLPEEWRTGRRWLTTVLAGGLLSIGIEWLQYRFSLGTTETDDVLCNTLGVLLSTGHLLFCRFDFKIQE